MPAASPPIPPIAEILLTRPEGSNDALRHALETLRPPGATLRLRDFPLLVIRPARSPAPLLDALAAMRPGDVTVFVSPRAVSMADAIRPLREWPPSRVAAVGAATAQALQEAGLTAEFLPRSSEDSEGLLDCLSAVEMAGRAVWIMRGETGRELLAETLAARGAHPRFVPVYRRECPPPASAPPPGGPERLWIITAPQALDCLAGLAASSNETDDIVSGLLDSNLVVINERARERARRLGFRGEIVLAGSPAPCALAEAAWAVAARRPIDGTPN
ncbi:uroporphyrinogen-III synthase [Guyparkeria sp. 1SP6A2]|nr:uroporphyrinogen-III synthase [Guyparkeria sp. 1SP6A2]